MQICNKVSILIILLELKRIKFPRAFKTLSSSQSTFLFLSQSSQARCYTCYLTRVIKQNILQHTIPAETSRGAYLLKDEGTIQNSYFPCFSLPYFTTLPRLLQRQKHFLSLSVYKSSK